MPKTSTKKERKSGYIRKRGADGLMAHQRHFLTALQECGDIDEAVKTAKIERRSVLYWLRSDSVFLEKYSALFDSVDRHRTNMKRIAEQAVDTVERAHAAMKGISTPVTCPQCQHNFSVYTKQEDWQTRMRAAEVTLKSVDILGEKKTIKIEGEVLVLTMAEKIALAQITGGHGARVSLQIKRELFSKGAIDQKQLNAGVIEVESRDVTDEVEGEVS